MASSKIPVSTKVSNPPGGRSSDIFNDDRATVTPSPRKVKDYMKSHVFNGDACDGVKVNRSPRVNSNTQDRLFGATDNALTPRRQVVNDTYRSNVFHGDGQETMTPRKKSPTIVNPITGDKLMLNGDYASQSNGTVNGHGAVNGHGYSNGVHHDASPVTNGYPQKVRAPPGGVSHGLW